MSKGKTRIGYRYKVMVGEMGTLVIVDSWTAKEFDGNGDTEQLVNDLIDEMNRLAREEIK